MNPITDYLADTTLVPYVLDEFQYFFETAFDTTDASFSSCDSDRPKSYTGSDLLPLINHYLDVGSGDLLIPDRLATKTTVSFFSSLVRGICTIPALSICPWYMYYPSFEHRPPGSFLLRLLCYIMKC